jgi:TolB-like protein/Flp pilus assembly protein TadD
VITPSDIFLSYARGDQATARRFAEAFEAQGFSVWWDAALRSGEAWDQEIEKALRAAKAVVVLWSKRSVESRWVRAEATLADRNKTLVPVMIEPCDRPIIFELTQTTDLSHWSGDLKDAAWQNYVADVRRIVEKGGAASAEAPAPPTLAATPKPERGGEPGLAMLPIASRSGLPEDEAFAEDLMPEIMGELSRHGYSRVITAVATAGHRGGALDLRAIARELDVRYFVESHTRRVATNLRLMVQLTEGMTGNILWSQKYDRHLSELADLQDELAVEVASQIGEQVLRLEFEHVYRKSGNWTAWERALRSMACFTNISSDSLRIAIEEARQALIIAPDYALAHAHLSMSFATFGMMLGNGSEAAVKAEVRMHVKRALELAPNDSRVVQAVSTSFAQIGDFRAALRFAERAVELTPNVGHAHQSLAGAHLGLGCNEAAIAELDAEERIAPHDGIRYVSCCLRGMAYFAQGRLAEADAAFERSLKLNPAWIWGLKWKAILASILGRDEEALQLVRELRDAEPHITLTHHQAQTSLWMPDKDRAGAANEVLRSLWSETDGPHSRLL